MCWCDIQIVFETICVKAIVSPQGAKGGGGGGGEGGTTASLNCKGTDPHNSDSFTVLRIKGTKAWEGIHCTGVNSDGPRADHWRTPKSKVVGVDTKAATITDCILSVKCISNQDSAIA